MADNILSPEMARRKTEEGIINRELRILSTIESCIHNAAAEGKNEVAIAERFMTKAAISKLTELGYKITTIEYQYFNPDYIVSWSKV